MQPLSFYALVASIEKQKKTQDITVSYLERKRDDVAEKGTDKFTTNITKKMKYEKAAPPKAKPGAVDDDATVGAKNIFIQCIQAVESSSLIGKAFRFRYEKVGQNLKVQKPYVITKKMIKIKKDHVVQVR